MTTRGYATLLLVVGIVPGLCGCGSNRRHTYTFGPGRVPSITRRLPAVIAKPADARRARAIAARSSQLRSLLARAPYRLAAAGVWPGLGVNLTYRLKRPIDVNDVLPYAEVPPDAPSSGDCHAPYVSGWERLQASDVTRISARVDLKRGRLAEIWTNAVRGTVSPVPGRAFPQCEEK